MSALDSCLIVYTIYFIVSENTFVAVMITSSAVTMDDFSFALYDQMFEKPLVKKDCHVRMHLMTLSFGEYIDKPKINTMKIAAFKELMRDLIFDYDFIPKQKGPPVLAL